MTADYEKKKLREFPQKKFAEVVYQMRLADQELIPADTYEEELTIMEHHKADTKDHSVSGIFIQLLRSRSLINN